MPLFTIWRELDPELTPEEGEFMIARGIHGSWRYPEVQWQTTYGISRPGRLNGMCVYEAPTRALMDAHAEYCRVPFTEIREVTEVDPRTLAEFSLAEPVAGTWYLVERQFESALSESDIEALGFLAANCVGSYPGLAWDRSYWDAERRFSRCIFRAPSEEPIRAHSERIHMPLTDLAEVTRVHPSEYAWVFDSLGLPHHWEAPAAG